MELIERLKQLPDPPGENDRGIMIWNVREITLSVGIEAAVAQKKCQQALDLNAEIIQSEKARGATEFERARSRFNDYGSLLELEHYNEAEQLLSAWRAVFESENAVDHLEGLFTALADLASRRGWSSQAAQFERNVLRLSHVISDPRHTGIGHFNLANYLTRGSDWPGAVAHRIASGLMQVLIRSGDIQRDAAEVARDLQRAGNQDAALLPANYAALCAIVEQVEGVRFHELVERLTEGRISGDELL